MKSNYETMRDRMQLKFLEYDQQHMTEKFGLDQDENYLYIEFAGRRYRIGRRNGKAEWSENDFRTCAAAGYNEAMSIYDVLCCSRDGCRLSGRFCDVNHLKGTVQSSGPGQSVFLRQIQKLDGKTEQFCRACEALGGEKERTGDVSYLLHPFTFLPMLLKFWNSDEEFPASLKIMWDEHILDYVHYETTFFIAGHMLQRILELMNDRVDGSTERICTAASYVSVSGKRKAVYQLL